MKSFFFTIALVATFLVVAFALPKPTHLRVLDGDVIKIPGGACKKLMFGLFEVQMETVQDPNNPDETISTPSINPYDIKISSPFKGLKWITFSDIQIEELEIDFCTVQRNDKGYMFEIHGVNGSLSTDFRYKFEKGFPIESDKGHIDADLENGIIFASLIFPDSEGSEWDSKVHCHLPKLDVTISKSQYSSLYQGLIEENRHQITTLVRMMVNAQLETWLKEFCAEDDQCSDEDSVRRIGDKLDSCMEDDSSLDETIETPLIGTTIE